MRMEVRSLKSLVEAANLVLEGESVLKGYLSSFICVKNLDVQTFLLDKAIENEKRSFTRTFLVVDKDNKEAIIGYFTLVIKPFDIISEVGKSVRSKLANNREAQVFNTILIAQLGRSDSYKDLVEGSKIVEIALEHCQILNNLSAIRIVCVEYENVPVLVRFYENNGFNYLQTNPSGYVLSYLRL